MRFVFQPLVERFKIPRPTLIEWQKHIKKEKLNNWRASHLTYLREQIDAEIMTKQELLNKGILLEDLFSIGVYLFLTNKKSVQKREEFKRDFRHFMLYPEVSIEYQHDFAKKIWRENTIDGTSVRAGEYINVFKLIDTLTTFQYYVLLRTILGFVYQLYENENMMCKSGLIGKTWQELYMYDKAFSYKNIETYFKSEGII